MACILDYLDWRGDLPLQAVPFCEVDAVILTRLSYLPFGGVVGEAPVSLGDAAARVRRLLGPEGDGREVRNGRDFLLLDALVDSPRFSVLSLAGYVERFDKEAEKQFSAITVLLPDGIFVAYRGTDGTVIGWKEDFNMGLADHVPAQTDAVAYLEEAAGRYPGTIRVGGHSKGGNLAVYAAAFCAPEIQARILSVQNNDGPGFPDAVAARESFRRILPRVHTYLPQSSVVGLLMGHGEAYTIVHSTNSGLKQHDMYSWEVARDHLAVAEGFTEGSRFFDATVKNWFAAMPVEQRKELIDGIYSVITSSDAEAVAELRGGKSALTMLKAAAELDEETRHVVFEAFRAFFSSAKKAAGQRRQSKNHAGTDTN